MTQGLIAQVLKYRRLANLPREVSDEQIIDVLEGLENAKESDVVDILKEEFSSAS
jgi:hypothetical protein